MSGTTPEYDANTVIKDFRPETRLVLSRLDGSEGDAIQTVTARGDTPEQLNADCYAVLDDKEGYVVKDIRRETLADNSLAVTFVLIRPD